LVQIGVAVTCAAGVEPCICRLPRICHPVAIAVGKLIAAPVGDGKSFCSARRTDIAVNVSVRT
jgi:hypothetical protein